MSNPELRCNQIIFLDLDYKDTWDDLQKGRPFVITKIEKSQTHFFLRLLIITSQDKDRAKEEEKQFISQYEIRQLPSCLKIIPSFVRLHRPVNLKIKFSKLVKYSRCEKHLSGCFTQKEYNFIVQQHEDYRNDKLNSPWLRPAIDLEID